uniref:Olfactory receptor 79 n=1 Tax=Aulacocentrum confusum TaxID=2767324 RepID=A0A7G8Z998_9HYME|nr:olfactory receptor 79 [Aulacocentrum confusum]
MADLVHVAGNPQLMIENLMESSYTLMSLVGMLVVRFSKTIRDLLIALQDQIKTFQYENMEEQMIFIKYYSMVRVFNKTAITFSATSVILYYLKPAISFFVSNLFVNNQTIPLKTPTRIRFFFDIYADTQTTAIFYILESPVMYIEVYRVAKISLLMTLVFTVCIQISILSQRVKNFKFTQTKSHHKFFCNFIEQHLQSINMTKSINNSFCALLFFELTVSTLLLSLIGFNTMMNFDDAQILIIMSVITYAIAMLLVILAHCIIGEFLIMEV